MGYNAHRFDLTQLNLMGNPLGMINPMTPPQMNLNGSMNTNMGMPPSMMRPTNEPPGSNLGFQMNPVSKNSKKK